MDRGLVVWFDEKKVGSFMWVPTVFQQDVLKLLRSLRKNHGLLVSLVYTLSPIN